MPTVLVSTQAIMQKQQQSDEVICNKSQAQIVTFMIENVRILMLQYKNDYKERPYI